MRNLLIIFFIGCLCISGCGNDFSGNRSVADSIKVIPKYTDSFIKVEQDKIIGDLRFGMNKEAADKEIEKFKNENKGGHIGNYEYSWIKEKIDDNKIFGIYIEGQWYAGVETMRQVDDLTDLMEKKFGKADYYKDFFFKDVKNDKEEIGKWIIGRKTIKIIVRYDEGYYHVDAEIYLPDIEEKVNGREYERKKQIRDSITNDSKNVF